jgi:hypothetical protein
LKTWEINPTTFGTVSIFMKTIKLKLFVSLILICASYQAAQAADKTVSSLLVENAVKQKSLSCKVEDDTQFSFAISPKTSQANSDLNYKGNIGLFSRSKSGEKKKDCKFNSNSVSCDSYRIELDFTNSRLNTESNQIEISGKARISRSDVLASCTIPKPFEQGDVVHVSSSRLESRLQKINLLWTSRERFNVEYCESSLTNSTPSCKIIGKNNGYSLEEFKQEARKLSEMLGSTQKSLDNKRAGSSIAKGAAAGTAFGILCGVATIFLNGDPGKCAELAIDGAVHASIEFSKMTPRQKGVVRDVVNSQVVEKLNQLLTDISNSRINEKVVTPLRLDTLSLYIESYLNN